MSRLRFIVLALPLALSVYSSNASAQSDANTIPAARDFMSPERMVLELRGGPYQPDFGGNGAFDRFFGGDQGPFLGLQLSYIAFRIDDVLYLTAGGGLGWSNYDGRAVAQNGGDDVSEETTLTLLPVTALASIRIDALARLLHIPFIVAAKVGFQWTHWDTDTGARDEAEGWSVGLMYAGQLALDLDSLDTAAARSMDEEWGINHSFLFFEFYHFQPTDKSLPVGGTGWVAGLGFHF